MEIQTAVHKIYQQLSVTLERALQANKHHIGKDMPRIRSKIREFGMKILYKIVSKIVFCVF